VYYTASDIVTFCRWPSGAQIERELLACAPEECDDTRCFVIQFDLLMMSIWCSKHVEKYNKRIIKQEFVY